MPHVLILLRGNIDPELLTILISVGILILLISLYFSRKTTVLRNLREANKKAIISFKDGDKGRISGEIVLAGGTLTAPLSGRRCSYYYIIIEEYHSNHGNGTMRGHWSKIFEEEKAADVVISDGTGYAIVDTRTSLSYIFTDFETESGRWNDPTPELKAYLSRVKIDPEGFFGFNKRLRYFEGVLEAGEQCTVSGTGQWNSAADHKLRIPSKDVLVMTVDDHEKEKVFISDHPDANEMN